MGKEKGALGGALKRAFQALKGKYSIYLRRERKRDGREECYDVPVFVREVHVESND